MRKYRPNRRYIMEIFNSKTKKVVAEDQDDILIKTPTNGAVISKCMSVSGNIKSCEPITIEGHIVGNILCEDIVVILYGGSVTGKIEAKEVRVDGRVEGPIEAKIVEQTKTANHEGYILADIGILNGSTDGDIICKETLEIGKNAKIDSYECKAEIITVDGELNGNITASKLLEARESSTIKGVIKTKELKSETGSKILGSIESFLNSNIINKKLNITSIEDMHKKEVRRIG